MDQYEVAKPNVSVVVNTPNVIGNEAFNINVEIMNTGKVEATLQLEIQSLEFEDSQITTIPEGETKLLQYSQQISKDMTYTFTFTGDLEQTIQKQILFGEKAEVQLTLQPLYQEGDIVIPYYLENTGVLEAAIPVTFTLFKDNEEISKTTQAFTLLAGKGVSGSLSYNLSEGLYILRYETTGFQTESQVQVAKAAQGEITMEVNDYYPEGTIVLPYVVNNTGPFDAEFRIEFELGTSLVSETTFIPAGGNYTGDLRYDLPLGDYTINATLTSQPSSTYSESFRVIEENKAEMTISLGTQANGLIPVNVNIVNIGFNTIEGSLRLSAIPSTDSGQAVWNGEEPISQLLPQNSQFITLNVNPSGIPPGNYNLRVELLNNSNQLIAARSLGFGIQSAIFQITQLPSYQIFNPGQEATFVFRVKNSGNQEGSFDLNFKAYDLINLTQREWLKPNEEKALTYGFVLPEDLEEKDYIASYELKDSRGQGFEGSSGQIKYHLAGINLNVNASLDKTNYNEGEIAHLTISILSNNPNPQNLFARVQYNGYESQQAFMIGQGQALPLQFDIPLPSITGEKLFYGIYYESGRSIHLSSLYIHKAGDILTIETDKQVYNPGENVFVTVIGNISGNMTLSGPGGYAETFLFSGQEIKSFALPAIMGAGTYFINVQLTIPSTGSGQAPSSELITVVHPFDVAGIQVKVLECQNDKGKYASTDTITTNFTISSNTSMPAILKGWIVDPKGQYASIGEQNINLSSLENSLVTHYSPLITEVSGIHRLVYGIYNSGDLLLCSGSEAFDVGDAVLLGVSTEKVDYLESNEPVHVKVSLLGTIDAVLELQVDENLLETQPVSLNGYSTTDIVLKTVDPGAHLLKCILTAGDLKSEKETTFTYGSILPDLILQLSTDQTIEQSTLKLFITAINQGNTETGTTTLHLYDGTVLSGTILTTLDVNGLSSGESQSFTYNLNVLGRTGKNIFSARIDPGDVVDEFNESNNESQLSLTVPELTLSTVLEKDVYSIGETLFITGLITNLSKDPLEAITLTTMINDPSGTRVFTYSENILYIAGKDMVANTISWLTDIALPDGAYTISQTIEGRDIKTQKTITLKLDQDFTITSDLTTQRVEMGEVAQYNLTLTPVRSFVGEVNLSIIDVPTGFTAFFTSNPVYLSETPVQLTLKMIPTSQVKSGSYTMKLTAEGGGISHDLSLELNLTDFQMTITPTTQTIQKLAEATYSITLTPINGFDSLVDLEIGGVPKSMKANLSINPVTLPQNVSLTLTTSKWLLPGVYTLSIIAKGKVINHTSSADLVVEKNPSISPRIVTAPGPGAKNKPIINTFNTNGVLLGQFQAFDTGYGANITTGDTDGDGVDEIILGTGTKDRRSLAHLGVFKRDGRLVATMETEYWGKKFGITVASADVDEDWIEEVAVGSFLSHGMEIDDEEENEGDLKDGRWVCKHYYHQRGHGIVKMYKVAGEKFIDTGLMLYPYEEEGYRGAPNIAFGDVDGDGVPELITAPGPDHEAPAKIKVFKIDTNEGMGRWKIASLMAQFTVAFEEKKEKGRKFKDLEFECNHPIGFGANIASGDLDGDGRAEIIIGAGPDLRNRSMIKVYEGDGRFKGIQFMAYPDRYQDHDKDMDDDKEGWNRYGVYVAAGDIEEDGICEILTGMGPGPVNETWVRMFRGNGELINNGFLAYPKKTKYGVRPSGMNMGK
jgi:uncharacterized membrane protein